MQTPDPLRALIQAAKSYPELPLRFQDQVWSRIASQEESQFSWSRALNSWLAGLTPRFALASCLALLLSGSGLGIISGLSQSHKSLEQAKLAYMQSVNPLNGN